MGGRSSSSPREVGGTLAPTTFRTAAIGLALLLAATAGAQTSFNTALEGHEGLTDAADVSAEGDLAFVALRSAGLAILDLSVPGIPFVVGTWQHPTATMDIVDARPLDGVLWLANQSNDTFALVGLDIADPANPVVIAELGAPEIQPRVHNLAASGDHLFLAAFGDGQANHVVDVSDPHAPVVVATLEVGMHDNAVVGDRLYTAGGYDGLFVYDITTPADPILLTSWTANTPDTLYYTHNAYPLADDHVIVTEEVQLPADDGSFTQGSVRVLDIGDLSNPVEVWRWRSTSAREDPLVTPHNAFAVGDFVYLSHYQDGLKIFDVSDPTSPVEVAFYDTYPDPPGALFEGNWGVDPFQGMDRIFLSDRRHGFFHVSFNGARKATLQGTVRDQDSLAPIHGARVESFTALRHTVTGPDGGYRIDTGAADHAIYVSAPGYIPRSQVVSLGDLATVTLDFELPPQTVGANAPSSPTVWVGPPAPNPFRTLTGIPVRAENGGEIAVFDAVGRRVRTLLVPPSGSDPIEVTFDGRDHRGGPLGAGVYFLEGLGATPRTSRRVVLTP